MGHLPELATLFVNAHTLALCAFTASRLNDAGRLAEVWPCIRTHPPAL